MQRFRTEQDSQLFIYMFSFKKNSARLTELFNKMVKHSGGKGVGDADIFEFQSHLCPLKYKLPPANEDTIMSLLHK